MKNPVEKLKAIGKIYRDMPMTPLEKEHLAKVDARIFAMLAALPAEAAPSFATRLGRIYTVVSNAPRFFTPPAVLRVMRPVSFVALASFVMLGGVAIASAFSATLPGHPLYSMKRATESAQLVFAIDPSTKAHLRLEFAGRRLDEAAKIAEGTTPNRDADFLKTVTDFNDQLSVARSEMETLGNAQDAAAIQVAKDLDRTASTYSRVLKQNARDASHSVAQQSQKAAAAADEVSIAAVKVLLKEQKKDGVTGHDDIARRVGDKLRELEDTVQLLAVRITALPSETPASVAKIGGPSYGALLIDLQKARAELENGKNIFAHGGYEAALASYRAGVGITNNIESGIGLYEEATVK